MKLLPDPSLGRIQLQSELLQFLLQLCADLPQNPFRSISWHPAWGTIADAEIGEGFRNHESIPAIEVPGPVGPNADGDQGETGKLSSYQGSHLELMPGPLGSVGSETQLPPFPRGSKDGLEAFHPASGAGPTGRPESVLMNYPGDVFSVSMFTDKDNDPFLPVMMDQGKKLAVPEDKDERLSFTPKL